MARGRTQQPPIIRNMELYHEFVCEHKTQAEIAEEFELSQPRVAAVCRQVERWVESVIAPVVKRAKGQLSTGKTRLNAGQKLHLAIAMHCLELKHAYGKFLDFFGGTEVAFAFFPLLQLWDDGAIPGTLAALLPPRDTIRRAIQMAAQLDELARLAERGPYRELPDELLKVEASRNQPPTAPPAPAATAV